jgi:hypothetical protein
MHGIPPYDGLLMWTQSPTPLGTPIDDLFDANVIALEHYAAINLPKDKGGLPVNAAQEQA